LVHLCVLLQNSWQMLVLINLSFVLPEMNQL
jgi:hypothetical protein